MKAQQILETFMDTADGAFATDARGKVVAWNRSAKRITGRRDTEAIGRTCWEVLEGRDSLKNLVCFPDCHVMAMAVRGEQPAHQDLAIEAQGKEISLDISTTLVRGEDQEILAVVHTFRDVTERRQMETHLRRALGDESKSARNEPPESIGRLTTREQEILRLLTAGLPTPAIAKRLSIRGATVRNHVQRILKKLAVHSKLEAVVLANQYDLTSRR